MLKNISTDEMNLIDERILAYADRWRDNIEGSDFEPYNAYCEANGRFYTSLSQENVISKLDNLHDGFYSFNAFKENREFIWIFRSDIIPYADMIQDDYKSRVGLSDSIDGIKKYAKTLETLKNKEYAIVARDLSYHILRNDSDSDMMECWNRRKRKSIIISNSGSPVPRFIFKILVLSDLK